MGTNGYVISTTINDPAVNTSLGNVAKVGAAVSDAEAGATEQDRVLPAELNDQSTFALYVQPDVHPFTVGENKMLDAVSDIY